MVIDITKSNIQADGTIEPTVFIDGDVGYIEYRWKYPVTLDDINIMVGEDHLELLNDHSISIYYRLGYSVDDSFSDDLETNPPKFIRLVGIKSDNYTEYGTDITDLIKDNSGKTSIKTQYPVGCKVFGIKIIKFYLNT